MKEKSKTFLFPLFFADAAGAVAAHSCLMPCLHSTVVFTYNKYKRNMQIYTRDLVEFASRVRDLYKWKCEKEAEKKKVLFYVEGMDNC